MSSVNQTESTILAVGLVESEIGYLFRFCWNLAITLTHYVVHYASLLSYQHSSRYSATNVITIATVQLQQVLAFESEVFQAQIGYLVDFRRRNHFQTKTYGS